jgi:hypothetical protein
MSANRWTAAIQVEHEHPYQAVLAAPVVNENAGVGTPPALAPGQAPLLPKAGPLAQPRSMDWPSSSHKKPAPPAGR